MLQDIHLDQISFQEMVDKAKNRIISFYPKWTDFNYHDPGITLIELFAWMKEIQQYEMDHIGERHKKKYLQLLGTGLKHRSNGECFVTADVSSSYSILEGCRMEAEGVIFETKEKQMLPGVSISCCFGWQNEMISFIGGDRLSLRQPFLFYPFGNEAKKGTCLYIGLSHSLPVGENIALTICVNKQDEYYRNPVEKDTVPLAKLLFSYWNGNRYEPVELIREETFGFLYDGQIVFRINSRMEQCKVGKESGYFLRIFLEESQYEADPVISFLDLNTMRVQQKETVAKWIHAAECKDGVLWSDHQLCKRGEVRVFAKYQEDYEEIPIEAKETDPDTGRTKICLRQQGKGLWEDKAFYILAYSNEEWYKRHVLIGTGCGFPDETFELDESFFSLEDLEILVEKADNLGIYQKWEKREDFACSTPSDKHYCIDSMAGRILFGNGIRGMAPEGKILLISYARILGAEGNIKAMRMQHFIEPDLTEIKVNNLWDAYGGRDEETMEDAFLRVRKEYMEPGSLVTAEDYEKMVKKTPGLFIESCKALFGTNKEVTIVVKPHGFNKSPELPPAFIKNILQHLWDKKLLGVQIKVVPPIYIKLSVFVEAEILPQYQEAESMIKQAITQHLFMYKKQFGGNVSYSSLYGCIDRLGCVAKVDSLTLEAKGNGIKRNPYGDLILPESGIVDVIDVACICSIHG